MSLQCRRNKDEYKDEYALFFVDMFFFFVSVLTNCPAQQNRTKQMTMLGLF